MAVQKFLNLVSGKIKEAVGLDSSAGAGSAGKLVALDSSGKINANMMPSGISAETVEVTASENLSQWDLVNIYDDSGTLKARKADGGTNKYVAHAFCPSSIDSASTGNVQMDGIITGTGLTPGSDYFLDDTAGGYTLFAGAPSGAGKILQKIGYAVSPTSLVFSPEQEIELLA